MSLEGIRNTASMCMDPQEPADYAALNKPKTGRRGFQLLPVFSGEAFADAVQYPIIVEMWKYRSFGRHRRRYLATFTQAERNKIAKYYGRFYKWCMVSGTPRRVSCYLHTIELLQRAVAFFAECG